MTKVKFIRTDSHRHSKLGRKRKKLQKWRKAKGRDNKTRLKRRNYPVSPTVGHKTARKESGKIKGKNPKVVYNLDDLEKTNRDSIVIVGKVGAKKKLEIIKKAREMKLEIYNIIGGKNHATA